MNILLTDYPVVDHGNTGFQQAITQTQGQKSAIELFQNYSDKQLIC